MWLNLGRVKPAGVAVGVLWGVVVWVLPNLRFAVRMLAEDLWKGLP
jgi:hypothetical protein